MLSAGAAPHAAHPVARRHRTCMTRLGVPPKSMSSYEAKSCLLAIMSPRMLTRVQHRRLCRAQRRTLPAGKPHRRRATAKAQSTASQTSAAASAAVAAHPADCPPRKPPASRCVRSGSMVRLGIEVRVPAAQQLCRRLCWPRRAAPIRESVSMCFMRTTCSSILRSVRYQ